jgi:hypothetical protein
MFARRFHRALLSATLLTSLDASAAILSLPPGPIYMTVSDAGQFSPSNALSANTEGAWGLVQILTMEVGKLSGGRVLPAGNPAFFTAGQFGGNQITGIYHGIKVANAGTSGTGGQLALYWQDVSTASVAAESILTANLGKRTAADQYAGFTQGSLLLQAAFSSGCDPNDASATICLGSGQSTGFLDVVGGLWAAGGNNFNSDLFSTPFGQRDMQVDVFYNANAAWDVGGTDITGFAGLDIVGDPITGVAISEPGSLALVLAAGFAVVRRRQRRTAIPKADVRVHAFEGRG